MVQKKWERAEKKWKEEAEEAAAESMKQKARSSKGKSKEVIVESDDNSEEPEVPKTNKRKLASGKSKTDKTVVKVVVLCFR
jgi:hypothetical protein